jgi:hypothetical protein
MADYKDMIDPARTELSRQKSLDKANERRVHHTTDVVERLRQNNKLEWDYTMELQEEASAEIERLRLTVMNLCVANGKHEDEIERLNKAIKWEQNWLSRIGTHSEGCWQWGPTHYQCALRHIEELSNAS